MKRYPAYKDSGVEWFEKLPSSWGLKKLKHISEVINGSTPKSGIEEYWDGDIVWITPNDLGHSNGSTVKESLKQITTKGLNSCGTKLTPPGSIILSTRAPIGHIAMTSVETCTNQGCKTVVPNNEGCYNRFLFYYLLSSKLNLQSLGQGSTFSELSSQNLKDFKSPFPSNEEQGTIAKFLDHKTHLIDTLIEKKQSQIELLQEQRAVIINQAVTKGLNPNVGMKDSGIEWLGEVPEQWGKKKIGYLLVMMGGSTPNKSEPAYWEGTTPWISPKDMKSFQIGTKAKDFISKKALEETSLQIIPRSTVLIVVRGMILAHTFPVGLTTLPLTINQDMKALTPSNECKSLYLARLLQGISPYILSLVEPSAHGTMCLRTDNFRNLYIYLPKLSEQDEIVEYIERTEATIDESITKLVKIIRLLREYRTTLISEVVTGKIDVRDEAIP